MIHFFVEHASKGVLLHLPDDDPQGEGKFRWSWSKPRSDARSFPFQEQADRCAQAIPGAYVMEFDPTRPAGSRFRRIT